MATKKSKKDTPTKIFAGALLTQVLGKAVHELVHKGMMTPAVQSAIKALNVNETFFSQGTMAAVAAIQTAVKLVGGEDPKAMMAMDILINVLGEVDDAVRAAKTPGEFTPEEAKMIEKRVENKVKQKMEAAPATPPKPKESVWDKVKDAAEWLKGPGAQTLKEDVRVLTNRAHGAERGAQIQRRHWDDVWRKGHDTLIINRATLIASCIAVIAVNLMALFCSL